MKNIAIFASGNGTNCENIIRYFENSETVCVALVVCNNKSAQVIKRAEKFGVPVEIVNREGFKDSSRVLPLLAGHNISYIILAGFMLLLPDYLTEAYKDRIVNIHPSLLPKYGGKGMYGDNVHKAVKENGEKERQGADTETVLHPTLARRLRRRHRPQGARTRIRTLPGSDRAAAQPLTAAIIPATGFRHSSTPEPTCSI